MKVRLSRIPAAKTSTREELFRRLEIAREYLHGNATRQISLEDIAREACISRYHLHRIFKRVFQQTPHSYLTALRLARARSLLEHGSTVTDVALDVGFHSVSAFSRIFHARYGCPPSSVRKIRKIGQALGPSRRI
jgi:AraC family transcriptional regulator